MKISESWLREWADPQLTTAALAEQITMAGLEVDAIEPVAPEFTNVIVGEILFVEQHQDADKLRVCQVAGVNGEISQVVCGAPNARVGIKVPFATIGAVLPGDFKIKKAKLRGVESFGMLCAQTELGLGNDNDGLWELASNAPVGKDLRDYLELNDQCIDIDLTPNRSDCLSIKGIAREVGVLNRLAVNAVEIKSVPAVIDDTLAITLQAPEDCPRYVGRVIRDVDLSQPSPLWMQERLRRSGIASKDIAVDTTNYVLLELGQPMHAFDLSLIEEEIIVRRAASEESLSLLNGQTVELSESVLVIADKTKALAMAGVMGGSESAVNTETKDLFLESAFFVPTSIAGRAREYGLHTDSSHRFERGVDYQLQELAIERATRLIIDVAGGKPGPVTVKEVSHSLLEDSSVNLRRDRILKGLGFELDDAEVVDILTRLGLEIVSQNESGWQFRVPSYRFDISIEADLLEELARVYGYNRLPITSMNMAIDLPINHESIVSVSSIQSTLMARAYNEAITYSFVDPKMQLLIDPNTQAINLQNPISNEMSVMRTSLWTGLLTSLVNNVNRQQNRVRLFETGLRFLPAQSHSNPSEQPLQQRMVAGLLYGSRESESWLSKSGPVDFFDIKGDVECLLELTSKTSEFTFVESTHPALHPGQTAALHLNGEQVGYLGALHPQIQKELGLAQSVFLFEINQSALSNSNIPSFAPLSRFPEVRRDIAIIIDQELAVSDLEAKVKEVAGELLTKLKVFDVYVGKGIDSHRKSVALGLTFQHLSRTLNDEEINSVYEGIISELIQSFNAELR